MEEAEYLLELISAYNVTMPVAFDWENIDNDEARTDDLDGTALTDCAIAFCERIRQAGYTPAVYAYRYLAYFRYELPRLTDYQLWIGAIGDSPDFYYAHDIWQYSAEGSVGGVDGPVDLNLLFREQQPSSVQSSASPDSPPASAAPAAAAGAQPSAEPENAKSEFSVITSGDTQTETGSASILVENATYYPEYDA